MWCRQFSVECFLFPSSFGCSVGRLKLILSILRSLHVPIPENFQPCNIMLNSFPLCSWDIYFQSRTNFLNLCERTGKGLLLNRERYRCQLWIVPYVCFMYERLMTSGRSGPVSMEIDSIPARLRHLFLLVLKSNPVPCNLWR